MWSSRLYLRFECCDHWVVVGVDVEAAIDSALAGHVASGQKHVVYLLLCMPVVGNPGMSVNISFLWNHEPVMLS